MDVSIAKAKNTLPELIRAVEDGQTIIITRHGKPVAQLSQAPKAKAHKVRFGAMKDRIQFRPGWDDPIDEDDFLNGNL